MQKIAIIGAGNFGFALTFHLDRKNDPNLDLCLYDHNQQVLSHIKKNRVHPTFFPTISLSSRVRIIDNLPELLESCDILILAMVSTALESVLIDIKPLITKPLLIVSVMKALDDDTGKTLTQVIDQYLIDLPIKLAVLTGGTTGESLVGEEYLGATLACEETHAANTLKQLFASPNLQIQLSADLIGAQYASSLKNLISLLVGLLKGLGFNYGTQTHGLSLIAHECQNLATQLGAQVSTFNMFSQCWGNDMVMSATSATRNHQLGILLGQGQKFSAAIQEMKILKKTVESPNTLKVINSITDLENFPLLNFLTQLSQEKVYAHQVVKIIENYPLQA